MEIYSSIEVDLPFHWFPSVVRSSLYCSAVALTLGTSWLPKSEIAPGIDVNCVFHSSSSIGVLWGRICDFNREYGYRSGDLRPCFTGPTRDLT